MTRRLAALAAVVLLGLGRLARADDPHAREEAAQFFRAAMAAYDRADYPAAARAFEAANLRVPDASAVYNAGRAWDAAHDEARAAEAYAAAVAGPTLDEASRTLATTRLAALDRKVAILSVTTSFPASVTVDRVHQAPTPVVVRLPPGTYDVTIEAADRAPLHRAWVGRAGERETLDLVPTALDRKVLPLPPAPRASPGLPRLAWAGIGVLGVGVAAAAAAAGLGVAALSANDDFNASGHTNAGLRSRAVTLQTLTNVAWATAGVGAGVGAVLLGVGLGKHDANATVGITTSGVMVTLRVP